MFPIQLQNCTDLDRYAGYLSEYNVQIEQLTRGRFSGTFFTADLGDQITLYADKPAVGLRSRVRVPKGMVAITMLLRPNDGCRVQGTQINADTVVIMRPGASIDVCSNPNSLFAVLSVPVNLLHASLDVELAVRPDMDITLLSRPAGQLAAARQSVMTTIKMMNRHRDPLSIEAARAEWRDSIVPCFLGLAATATGIADAGRPQKEIFSRACEWLEISMFENPSIAGLCAALGVSRRTLELSFERFAGISPARYLKLLKLNNIRRDLMSDDYMDDSIADIAARWGIWHPSRFAADYKAMFGENPSDARRQMRALP